MVSVLSVGWMSESDLLRSAAAVACGCGHPAAEPLLRETDARVLRVVDALNCELAPGGAAGVVAGSRILLGSADHLESHGVALAGLPPFEVHDDMLFVAADGRFAGVVRVHGW